MIKGFDEIEVITLFVDDVPAGKEFYTTVFGLDVVYEDEESAVVKIGTVLINLLRSDEAPALIEPTPVGSPTAGAHALYTISVEDADATVAELEKHGVALLNGPIDRPWGRRTAAVAAPAGNLWEIAQVID